VLPLNCQFQSCESDPFLLAEAAQRVQRQPLPIGTRVLEKNGSRSFRRQITRGIGRAFSRTTDRTRRAFEAALLAPARQTHPWLGWEAQSTLAGGWAQGALAGWLLLRRGFAVNFVAAELVTGTLAGLAGVTMLELHCANFQAPHVMLWHTAVMPLSGAAGALSAWLLRFQPGGPHERSAPE
jgi:hypothetical protein